MEKKRLDCVSVKKFIYNNENLQAEFEFNIVHKNAFYIMDRKITQNSIILKYNNGRINFSITGFGGIEVNGLNLKRKHIKDVIELLDSLKEQYKEVEQIIKVLSNNLERKKKTIVCVMGKSGSGKSTSMLELCKENDKYYMVKSFTTREERKEDSIDKLTHVFTTQGAYEDDCFDNKVLEVYHSPSKYISWATDDCFKEDKINLYAIDFQSYLKFKERKEYDVIGIYLDIDENERQRRLKIRESEKTYGKEEHLNRFSSCSYSDGEDGCFNIAVTNASVNDVAFMIDEIVKKELKK